MGYLRPRAFLNCQHRWFTKREQECRAEGAVREKAYLEVTELEPSSGEPLPPVLQVALHYATPQTRAMFANFFTFDALFARTVANAGQPLFAQLRLGWWRDELSRSGAPATGPTPLLNDARMLWGSPAEPIVTLLNGWENLLEEVIGDEIAAAFCEGRAKMAFALARQAGIADAQPRAQAAARRWSMAELAIRAGPVEDKQRLLEQARRLSPLSRKLPRALRPLAVLDALAQRSLKRGGVPLLNDRVSFAVAMRAGQFGR